jgi:AraC family transcriptional regulator of arabinose operon
MAVRIINLSQVNLCLRRSAVHFGEVEYAPGGRCGPRRQQDYQLVILHSGRLELHLDGERIRLEPGHARLLHPRRREDFYFSPTARTRHAWCSIKPTSVPSQLRRILAGTHRQCRWVPPLQQLFELGLRFRESVASPLETERCLLVALHLLAEFTHEAELQSASPVDQRLLKMQQFIACEYSRSLRLSDLARAAGVSRQHLLRLCRERKVSSPLEQLERRRLDRAEDLLVHTGLSIKEISEQCGFQNPFHFSRKFRQRIGRSPRQYRDQTQPLTATTKTL